MPSYQNLYNTQTGLAPQYQQLANSYLGQSSTLESPFINFNASLASGNPQAAIQAAAPEIGNIANQSQQARANIMNNTPAGAGRDYAVASLERSKASDVSQFLNQAILGGQQNLAQLGSQQAGLGLQEQGATQAALGGAGNALSGALGAYGTAGGLYNQILQNQAQNKSSTLGFLGNLAGAASAPFTFN